jgi:hypothetical protein
MTIPLSSSLQAALGPPHSARMLGSSPRSRVWVVGLRAGSAVVKQIVGGSDATVRYQREVTALRLAARVQPPVVPQVLGTDDSAHVIVLEHLADRGPGPGWILDYATALARLHAATSPNDAGVLPAWSGPSHDDVAAFLDLAGTLGAPVTSGVHAEMCALVDRLGVLRGHALLHGDPCPGNDLYSATGVRFVDLEMASLGSGLIELAYLHIGFPTCWCVTVVPSPLLARAEQAYRTAWREAGGSDPEGDLVDACAGWLIRGDALVERAHRDTVDHLARLVEHDWEWGTVSARERLVHRLDVVAQLTRFEPRLTGLNRLCHAMRSRMRSRWPALRPPPLAPARAARVQRPPTIRGSST